MVAYHVIFGAYGFWLPNDPRGSQSTYVGAATLVRFGKATKVATRRSVAETPHDAQLRQAAKRALKFPPVRFSGQQARAVGRGFVQACAEGLYVVHACAILPEHVHLVVAHHDRPVGQIVGHLKARATQHLRQEGLWTEDRHPVWAKNCWKVILNDSEDVRRAIEYVESNPIRENKPPQRWSFVTPYAPHQHAPGKPGG